MGEIKKIEKIDQIQYQDKESVIFDLSDNESEKEELQQPEREREVEK